MKRYSDSELLTSLKTLYDTLGRPITAKDVNASDLTANQSTYRSRFGSFNKAKELAGIPIKKASYTEDELIKLLLDYYDKYEKLPKYKDFTLANGLTSVNVFKEKFGTLDNLFSISGLLKEKDELRSNQLTDKDLLNSISRFYEETGRAPTHDDCNSGIYSYLSSHMVYYRRFNSWKLMLKLANVPETNHSNASAKEIDLLNFLKSVYKGTIECNSRDVIYPLELDIYLPELNLAIEFNGLYWHSSEHKEKSYHLEKTLACNSKGIKLIHVMEHEWVKRSNIVKSRILNAIGKSNKIYARKCNIKSLTNSEYMDFTSKTHIQGHVNASVKLGLFLDNELVACMSFCKSRFSSKHEYELLRYSSKLNHTVVGGASKLFKHFVTTNNPRSIVSYCDLRWGSGGLYETLGFTLSHKSKPNYWYFKGMRVESRVKYQKHKLPKLLQSYDETLTEWENMKNSGYLRYYDCGNAVYILSM